jgi:colicin import membrane protein
MQDADRTAFQPPKPAGTGRSVALALLAHGLLLLALTWGISWKSEPDNLSVTAELWSALPQEAAPKLQEPEPQDNLPTPTPVPVPPPPPEPVKAEPKPAPPPAPKAAAQPDDRAEADIALKKEKALREIKEREEKKHEEKKHEEQMREDKALKDKQLKEKELKAKAEKLKAEKRKEEQEREDKERDKKKLADKLKAEEKAKQQAEDKKRAEVQAKKDAQAKAEADKRSEAQRQENIRRMQGMAGATGDENAKGSALKASGPSASYAGRIRARIKPNITFTDDVDGNPKSEVEVRVAPDGTILSRKLIQASGNKAWDDAVLKAIDKTETLPRDTDGRVQPVMVISFRPKD